MKNSQIIIKNEQTDKMETIFQSNIEMVDWGFHFFVDGEMEAFKAAYQYRNNKNGVKVEFAKGVGQWMVTVFNACAAEIGIDGAR